MGADSSRRGCPTEPRATVTSDVPVRRDSMQDSIKKLTLSKETLRTLDEKELSLIVGGAQSGSNEPPRGGPNSCPNTKSPGCS
jgi:bacteriocin-like protein